MPSNQSLSVSDANRFVLPANCAAIVWDPGKSFDLLIPKNNPKRKTPREIIALVAIATRLSDEPEFVDDMIQWFEDATRS